MEEIAIRALVKSLLMCSALFKGPQPNLAELRLFEFKDGGILMETLDWNERLVPKPIEFNGTIEGVNLQMVVKGDAIELGGQVTVKESDGNRVHCPVAGDANAVRIVTTPDDCSIHFYVYRIKDKLYGIANKRRKVAAIFDLDGERMEMKEIPVVVDGNLGLNQAGGTYVYKDGDGKCQEMPVGSLALNWTPYSCNKVKISLVANQESAWYHVQYLQVMHDCELASFIPKNELKNVYVRFLYENVSLLSLSPAPSTERSGRVTYEEQLYIAIGVLSIVAFLLFLAIVLAYWFNRKTVAARSRRFRRPKTPEQKQVNPNVEVPHFVLQELTDEEDMGDEEDEENPLDTLPTMALNEGEIVHDDSLQLDLPTLIDLGTHRYTHVGHLGSGSYGTVHEYKAEHGDKDAVAVKFQPTTTPTEKQRAKGEFMLIRKIRLYAGSDPYVLLVLDVGQYPNYVFFVSPLYELCMQEAVDGILRRATYAQKLNACYQMLLGILDLQRLGYAHNDIKPANYMQRRRTENKIVLCDFGMAKKFGSKRLPGRGTLLFMPITALRGDLVSMVDDLNSWFYVYCVVVCGGIPYSPPTNRDLPYQQLVQTYLKAQLEGVPRFRTDFEDREIIGTLRELIWNKPPGDTIDMNAVKKTLDELQIKFQFSYMDPWWDVPPEETTKGESVATEVGVKSEIKSTMTESEAGTRDEPMKPEENKAELVKPQEKRVVSRKAGARKAVSKKAESTKPEEKKAENTKREEKKAENTKREEKKAHSTEEPTKPEEEKAESTKPEEEKAESAKLDEKKTEPKRLGGQKSRARNPAGATNSGSEPMILE
ncbi:unnamed protein product [Bursaphelenchus xylophilus]|uniref:(pine wood nematode) hypothetical protein n=1 Tax=Bursaphelenchus xylophilus TaxID=6326 RepID=A0A1I7SFI9_BURXY|nr:unnamed protein product [Bursaphelenchus xylophilus]CAG9079104.1 unnamed protein product [Bursaphelenchus xylophilus]